MGWIERCHGRRFLFLYVLMDGTDGLHVISLFSSFSVATNERKMCMWKEK